MAPNPVTGMKPPAQPGKALPSHYSVQKADGDAPLQDWITQIPGWQADRAKRIDAIITSEIPHVRKAVKWHGAWYGQPVGGWFLALNTFKAYLKLTFFDGALLTPPLPKLMAQHPAAALDLKETAPLDEDQIADWARQALSHPGLFKT